MKIFLITDIHYGGNSNYPNYPVNKGLEYINVFGGQFQKLISKLKPEMDACDLVVNLGDLIHDNSLEKDIENYKDALVLMSSKTPTKHVIGNHDLRNLTKETLASLIGEEKCYYSFDAGGYHQVVLDGNRTEPRGPNYVSEEQLVWLEEDLEKTQYKTILYCHYPLDRQSMNDNYYFSVNPELASVNNKYFVRKVLNKSGKVLAVFSGHTHFFCKQIIDGITYFTVPSFLENDGEGKPSAKYGIATIDGDTVSLEIKKMVV